MGSSSTTSAFSYWFSDFQPLAVSQQAALKCLAVLVMSRATFNMAQLDEIAKPSGTIQTAHVPAPVTPGVASVCGEWTIVKSADGPSSNSQLNAASASSANNVWALGGHASGKDSPFQTLTERWNGSTWSFVRSANGGVEDGLYGVAAISPTDVWAVGYFMPLLTSPQTAFIEHCDRGKWSVVPSPQPGQLSPLFGVRAVSANDLVIVSYRRNAAEKETEQCRRLS